jgi:hypothetical protein
LEDPILKKPFTKKGLVEWLKVKAPSSNHSTTKKKKSVKMMLSKYTISLKRFLENTKLQSGFLSLT